VALGFLNVLKRGRSAAPPRLRPDIAELLAPGTVASRPALVILSHPALQRSRVNATLAEAVRTRPDVTVHDLYRTYPDFLIDVEAEQKKLICHQLIVLQYPMYWYATPALLKEWCDTVLLHGFAFGRDGTKLHGKTLMVAMTTGGDRDAYHPAGMNRFTITELLRPMEATAYLCGLSWAEPFVVHDALHLDAEARAAVARAYDARISALVKAVGR
jgi:glutathione-regulated potassium-efflux system ancillary protein KefG